MIRLRLWCMLCVVACLLFVAGVMPYGQAEAQAAAATAGQQAAAPEASPAESPQTSLIPMRDGTKLATDWYLPESGAGPFPVMLIRTTYGKSGGKAFSKLFTDKGIAFVSQDTRGRGGSEGRDMIFFDDGWGTNQDGADTAAWIREQPWCNGKVGTFGMSALGITQLMMAPATPDLACQSIVVGASKFYGYLAYQGGVWRKQLCETWISGQKSPWIIDLWKSHPAEDDYWAAYDTEAQAGQITAPGLHVGGWWDIFNQGTINSFTSRQYEGGEGARGKQILVMGPWLHGPKKDAGDLILPDNFVALDFMELSMRFSEHWLLGTDNGVMEEPPVHYYTLGDVEDPDAPGNEWRTANDWPPLETVEQPWYLSKTGALTVDIEAISDGQRSYVFDPADPVPTHGGQNLYKTMGPMEQQELGERADVLTFLSNPLETPLEITGRVTVRLYVSTDAPDTDFTAKLLDVYPDGRQILMLDNIQRVKFRKGFQTPEPLPVGEIGEVNIDLWSISLIVNKGHRIGLHVSSSNYPRFEVNPNTGDDFPGDELRKANNTIHLGPDHPSALLLPVPKKVE